MSLLVNVFIRDDNHEIKILDEDSQGRELAGFETCRKTLYGANVAKTLGLVLLPLLREQDVYAESEDVELIQQEAEVILKNIELFVQDSGLAAAYIQERVGNIVHATERARNINGGVVIW